MSLLFTRWCIFTENEPGEFVSWFTVNGYCKEKCIVNGKCIKYCYCYAKSIIKKTQPEIIIIITIIVIVSIIPH